MHGDVVAIGPLMWALLALGVLSWLLALFVTVDALRRRPADFVGLPETRWPYVAVCAAHVVAYAAYQFDAARALAPWLGDVALFGVLASFALGFAYLLRVVFPRRAVATDAESADDPADTIEHEDAARD